MISDYPLLALGVALLPPLGGALLIRHQISVGRASVRGRVFERTQEPVDFWITIGVETIMSIAFFFALLFMFANQSRLKFRPAQNPPQAPQIDGVLAPTTPDTLPAGGVPVPIYNPQQLPISDRSEWRGGQRSENDSQRSRQ